uniref:Predicted protein n=1 Tax=Hordeum vulgare subsp. vulgare TaxID=112509 RepID=F2DCQ0_HORVV|nr:predicted protein [Hordeum vulgare subsp. vulgare]
MCGPPGRSIGRGTATDERFLSACLVRLVEWGGKEIEARGGGSEEEDEGVEPERAEIAGACRSCRLPLAWAVARSKRQLP